MWHIVMSNMGGELDRREASSEELAKSVLLEMIQDSTIASGDVFTVTDDSAE